MKSRVPKNQEHSFTETDTTLILTETLWKSRSLLTSKGKIGIAVRTPPAGSLD